MIKFTYKYLKPVALFLAIAVLFQCCKIYHKEPSSIENAIGPDKKKVKIITVDDRKLIFDSIYYRNDKLYGLLEKSSKKDTIEVPILPESVKEIHLYNTRKSATLSVLLVLGIPLTIIVIANIVWLFNPPDYF